MNRHKRERRQLVKLLDSMLELLDSIKTPELRCEWEPDPDWALRVLFELRRLHVDSYGRPPTHCSVSPDIEAELIMSRAFSYHPFVGSHIFGMSWHVDAEGRYPFEMWRED